MQFNPYLNFGGNCEEAFRFYADLLGGKIEMMQTFGDSPMAKDTPADWHGKVMHASLTVDGRQLMGSDGPADRREKMQGFALALAAKDVAEAERLFSALSEGGTVVMPLQETFWAERFGMATDRFGTPWMVNCDKAE